MRFQLFPENGLAVPACGCINAMYPSLGVDRPVVRIVVAERVIRSAPEAYP